MNPYLSLMVAFVIIFLALGLIAFNLAKSAPKVFPYSLISAAGVLHLALAVFCVFSLLIFGQEYAFRDCGLVPNTTTTSAGVTTFTWVDTCSSITQPAVLGALTTVYAWVLILEAIVLGAILPLWYLAGLVRRQSA